MRWTAALLLCASVAAAQDSPEEPASAEDDWELPDDLDELEDGGEEFDFSAADAAIEADEDSGPEISFSTTSTTVAQYRIDNFNSFEHDDDFASVWERLELNLQIDDLRINTRFDAFLPFLESDCPDSFDANDCLQGDARLERFTAHWEHEGLQLDAVDSYAVLGRGIALSMRRVDVIGVDTALRGGQVAWDGGGIYIKALGGAANPQNLDPQTLLIIREPTDRLRGDFRASEHDFLTGGEVGFRLADRQVELGLHALRVWFARNDTAARQATVDVGGWHLALPSLANGKISFYGEINALHRINDNELRDDSRTYGRGIYSSLQAQIGKGTLLLEWKDYDNYIVAETNRTDQTWRIYSAAPTLERDAERPRALYNARGGRVQLDYGFLPGPWSVSVNGLAYGHAEDEDVDPWDGILVTHGYAKIQKINDAVGADEVGWTLDIELGARRESYLEAPFDGVEQFDLDWRVLHASLEAGIVVGRHSLELSVIHRSERQRTFNLVDFVRGSASLTWSYDGRIRISPVLAWNSENASNPTLYPGAEARYDFLEGSFIRVFGGRTPGGRICSGGVCRDVPPFFGFLSELVIRL